MMKAAQLRQAILQAAVQGKLVPQNPHDEPASALLERIRAGKAKLVKVGKLKKDKSLPPITEDEIPYDLPNSWEWCRLGEIADLKIGKTPARADNSYWNNGLYPWVSIADMTTGSHINSTKEKISLSAYEKVFKKAIVPKGSLLFSFKLSIGKVSILDIDAFTNEAICSITPYKHPELIYYLFKIIPVLDLLSGAKDAIKGKTLNSKSLANVLIPLPPLAEQERIVTKIEKLMVICDELETVEKTSDTLDENFIEYLPKSILQAAVQGKLVPQNPNDEPASALLERIRAEKSKLIKTGKLKKNKPLSPITKDEIPYDLPDGWEWCRLGEVIQIAPNSNIHQTLSPDAIVNYVDIDAIDNKNYCINNVKTLPVRKLSSRARRVLKQGYTVYSLVRPYLNNLAIIEDDKENYIGSTGLVVFRPVLIENKYIFSVLLSPYIYDCFTDLISGFNSPGISMENFNATLFPIPPLAEQQRIVAKVDELMALCAKLKTVAENVEIPETKQATIIPLGRSQESEPLRMAARGKVNKEVSEAHRKAREDMFSDD